MIEISELFNDKTFTKDNVVANAMGIRNEEYSSLGVAVKMVCWGTQHRLNSSAEYISNQVKELENLLQSSYAGSDTHNERVERKVQYIKNLQITQDEMEAFQKAIYDVHLKEFDVVYAVPLKKTATSDVNSASFLEAQELLKQHSLSVSK